MMSGSVYEVPVLAYSTESSFDIESMPGELSQWLFLGSKKIAYLQEKQSSYIATSWNNELGLVDQWGNLHPFPEFDVEVLEEYEENIHGPLLNSLWGQGIGYNHYAPDLGCNDWRTGSNAWAGCVPVAIGQIMHYFQHPVNYNWSVMPQRAYSTGSLYNIGSAGSLEMSWLLRSLGNQLGVSWGCDATGVTNDNVKGVFNANNYSTSNLINYNYDFVRAQTSVNKPVYISGMNERTTNYAIRWKVFGTKIRLFKSYSYSGHAWVADGTKQYVVKSKVTNLYNRNEYITTNKSKYIHFNWGWTESYMNQNNPPNYNGWYYYDLFNPGFDSDENNLINYEDDDFSSMAPYNMKRRIIVNITPN